jgi:hypothetical protein
MCVPSSIAMCTDSKWDEEGREEKKVDEMA